MPSHALMPRDQAEKLVKILLAEGFSSRTLAERMGVSCQRVRFFRDAVTIARYQAIRHFYQAIMLEATDTRHGEIEKP